MTNKQRVLLHKYRDLEKEEIIRTIFNISKIKKQILFNSSFLELCEYLNKLKEFQKEIDNGQKRKI